METKNKYFCTAPWTSISNDVNGSLRPCCRYDQYFQQREYTMPWMKDRPIQESWNGPQMKKLRQAFIDGKKPNECRQCWNEEDIGMKSFRQGLNFYLEQYPRQKERYDFTSTEAPAPFYLDLKLSNVCNLKCRMCSPMTSSLFEKESKKHDPGFTSDPYWHQNKFLGTENEAAFREWLPHIDKMCFTGGEPFMAKENKDMLQMMIDEGHSERMDLHFNTNGMFMGKDIVRMLKRFKEVSLAFSVDDIGRRLNYHRSGADWNIIHKNILKAKKELPECLIEIYCTVNNYNIWYLDEALLEFKKLTKFVSYNFVYEPAYLSPRKLYPVIKEKLVERFKGIRGYEKLIDYIYSDDEDLTVKFHDSIQRMDKIRDEDFEDVFPEWAEIVMYG